MANRLATNGSGTVKHVYIGDGITPSGSRGGCIGVPKSNSGSIDFVEVNVGHASDNGVYAASTAEGGGGTQHFKRCLLTNNNVSHLRIASDGTTVDKCAIYNTNDVPLVSTCNCVNSRGIYDGYGSSGQRVEVTNTHIDCTDANTNGASSAVVASHVTVSLQDCEVKGGLIGNVETSNVGSNPSNNAPAGCPLTAEEAANGTSSAQGI